MQHGVKPVTVDKRDYDFHRTFAAKVGGVGIFPESFSVDAGLTMPNQDEENDQFIPPVPALPFGCTDYSQQELCTDEDKKLYNPMDLENVTHANADGGCDVRKSLAAALSVYNRQAYFNVNQNQGADFFDSIRAAIYAANRSVSIVTPWYKEWQQNGLSNGGLLKPQNVQQLGGLPWHNWKIPGWVTQNGVLRIMCKSWQGDKIGDKGWLYIDRETINAVMEVSGTGAFTLAPVEDATIMTIQIGLYQRLLATLKAIFHLY